MDRIDKKMDWKARIELLKSDRMKRIMQSDAIFGQTPPDDFIQSAISCVDKWLADRNNRHIPNGIIYHYCDANALLNILKTRKTWATSTKYLNDTTELLSLTSNFDTHAKRFRSKESEQVLADFIDFYAISADTRQTQTIGMDRYACCFSAAGDLLSQWRAYGNHGRGYAIGFDPSKFAGINITKPAMNLRRITYGGEKESQLIDDIVARFEPIVAANIGILDSTGWEKQSARNWLSMRFGECLLELVEEIKHPAFAEEDEWRLYAEKQQTEYRVSQNRIVPFKQLDLSSSENGKLLPIAEIVIGPCLDFGEAMASLTTFTSSLGYGLSMNFRKSRVPYR